MQERFVVAAEVPVGLLLAGNLKAGGWSLKAVPGGAYVALVAIRHQPCSVGLARQTYQRQVRYKHLGYENFLTVKVLSPYPWSAISGRT